jgi:PBSX family phage terminase large subunit
MEPIIRNVSLLRHQMDFVQAPEKFVLFSGGIGSGKTHGGAHFVLKMITEYPKARGFIGANSYKQLHNSVLVRVKAELDSLGLQYRFNSLTGILNIEGTEVYTGTLEKGSYDNHRGIEIGWCWCDEVRDLEHEAWKMLMGRLRDVNGPLLMRGTTSPAGFNWLYDLWVDPEQDDPEYRIIRASSHGNTYLPDGYIESMAAGYDELFYQQEVLGEFVNLTSGKIYRSYKPEINDIEEFTPDRNRPILIGMDFNVSPMTAAVCQKTRAGVVVFDEIWMNDANTYEISDEIKRRYGDWNSTITIYPDHTGAGRKTSSIMSDHQILKKAGFNVKTSRNPLKEDRFNAINGMLDHNKIQILKKCKMLRRDLRQVMYEENADYLTHISDALGYLVWREFPIRSTTQTRTYNT